MPGISRYGINRLKEHLDKVIENGLQSVLLFGVIDKLPKVYIHLPLGESEFVQTIRLFQDEVGTHADSNENPVIRALPKLRKWFPLLTIACDVCLCPYTSHGHCGILNPDGSINNSMSLERISDIALAYAKAGLVP